MSKKAVQNRLLAPQINPISSRSSRAFTPKPTETYRAFDQIDGTHPWQKAVPDGFVQYQVRRLERGKVSYFNFNLAREMGLIAKNHPEHLTPELNQKLLDTFSIQIINEYDREHGARFPKDTIKQNQYMATRYLQLQHSDKRGRTSGDGRSIWNGTFRHNGITWDISSRGTGVTCLAPGAVEAQRPLKTGAGEFGYGCGLADISELVGSSIMSEIFHLNGVATERMLTIIDLGRGTGIGVRAAPNLIRPAHLFLYLKQGRLDTLKQATDYLISRQVENGRWGFDANAEDRYSLMLHEISSSFARFAARLERNYIFAWLDWDGDNVLAEAGIIDYGSIRQFGLRHDQYRYDDVTRFSTNLNEQRGKARLTVQLFAQLVDFIESGRRRSLDDFANHNAVCAFDREYDLELRKVFLSQVGLNERQSADLLKSRGHAVEKLYLAFMALEKTKTKSGTKKLPDGVNRPAVFNMRKALRELPTLIASAKNGKLSGPVVTERDVLDLIASSHARRADLRLKGALREKLRAFIDAYLNLLGDKSEFGIHLRELAERAHDANRPGRITGNGAEFIVDAILKAKKRGLSVADLQVATDLFVASQTPKAALAGRRVTAVGASSPAGQLFRELVDICQDYEEDI